MSDVRLSTSQIMYRPADQDEVERHGAVWMSVPCGNGMATPLLVSIRAREMREVCGGIACRWKLALRRAFEWIGIEGDEPEWDDADAMARPGPEH